MCKIPASRPACQARPRVKPARSVNLILRPTATMEGIVRLTVGRSCQDYNLARLPSDFGAAFRLVKILGEHDRYDVCLDGEHSTCECNGFLRHGHCKHVAGLAKLVERGLLDRTPLRHAGAPAAEPRCLHCGGPVLHFQGEAYCPDCTRLEPAA